MVNTPYGSSIHWGDNWRGAHLVQDIALKAFNIQPTISWKITDKLSIGAGLMMEFGNIQAEPRADRTRRTVVYGRFHAGQRGASSCLRRWSVRCFPLWNPFRKRWRYTTMRRQLRVALQGDAGVRLGFIVGAMYDVNEHFTVGVSYRSKVTARVKEGRNLLKYAK